MSNVKHTAGPWFVNDDHKAMSEYCVCAESRGKGFGSSVATVTQRDGEKPLPHDEAMANARLIAAAPELLEALQNLLNAANLFMDANDGRVMRGIARDVIAKAAGADHE